ncbi:hypothetical protein NQ315_017310 [Exocentrus adspersus]|uniref:Ribosomal RNA-processing protein 8 n=1 Tax=Exocentrus adspersus TaxID=1586481 RepID=A0AAV8VKL6_9CUCU|nr:hypothetical protein NQ315_017310 [Exocentrus adspersus]
MRRSFKTAKWDSDAEYDSSYRQLFKEDYRRRKMYPSGDDDKEKRLKRLLWQKFTTKEDDMNVITVQTKIALGKSQHQRQGALAPRNYASGSSTNFREGNLRKKCKKSRAEMSSDSDESEDEEEARRPREYSSDSNSDSEKLSKELLREQKRQKKLKKKLEKAARKQQLLTQALQAKMKDKLPVKKVKEEPVEMPLPVVIKQEPVDDEPKPIKRPFVQPIQIKQEPVDDEPSTSAPKINEKVEKKREKPILTLRQKMMEKLRAARFRFLNEQIYKTDGKEAQKIFKSDPEAFIAYHEGYRQQVKSWPLNPLDIVISGINRMPKNLVIADFGCGEAKLARCVEQKVHSFDLLALNDMVVACDMANVPLKDSCVDVGVFCLSLMGTNLRDYLLEANRVLRLGGILKIAEVQSRFDNVDNFIAGLQYFGFKRIWKDLSHNLFYFMDFKKVMTIRNKKKLPTISLLPCLYKKR